METSATGPVTAGGDSPSPPKKSPKKEAAVNLVAICHFHVYVGLSRAIKELRFYDPMESSIAIGELLFGVDLQELDIVRSDILPMREKVRGWIKAKNKDQFYNNIRGWKSMLDAKTVDSSNVVVVSNGVAQAVQSNLKRTDHWKMLILPEDQNCYSEAHEEDGVGGALSNEGKQRGTEPVKDTIIAIPDKACPRTKQSIELEEATKFFFEKHGHLQVPDGPVYFEKHSLEYVVPSTSLQLHIQQLTYMVDHGMKLPAFCGNFPSMLSNIRATENTTEPAAKRPRIGATESTDVDPTKILDTSKNPYKVWVSMYNRLKEFKSQHGHCLVPQPYEDDPKLGNWVSKLRSTMKKQLSDGIDVLGSAKKAALLDKIGFDWKISSAATLAASLHTKASEAEWKRKYTDEKAKSEELNTKLQHEKATNFSLQKQMESLEKRNDSLETQNEEYKVAEASAVKIKRRFEEMRVELQKERASNARLHEQVQSLGKEKEKWKGKYEALEAEHNEFSGEI